MYLKDSPEISYRKQDNTLIQEIKNRNTFDIVSEMYHRVFQKGKLRNLYYL